MTEKFCVYCQEKTEHYINEYYILECSNCVPLDSDSDYSDYSSSDDEEEEQNKTSQIV